MLKQLLKFSQVLEGYVRSSTMDVFDPETYTGHWRGLTLRSSEKTQELMMIVLINPQQLSQEQIHIFKDNLKDLFTSGKGKDLNLTSLYYQELTKK